MSLILVAKNESGNKQKANPPHPPNQFKGKAILCASPLNPAYPAIRLKDFSQVSCCGRVVGKLKRK